MSRGPAPSHQRESICYPATASEDFLGHWWLVREAFWIPQISAKVHGTIKWLIGDKYLYSREWEILSKALERELTMWLLSHRSWSYAMVPPKLTGKSAASKYLLRRAWDRIMGCKSNTRVSQWYVHTWQFIEPKDWSLELFKYVLESNWKTSWI